MQKQNETLVEDNRTMRQKVVDDNKTMLTSRPTYGYWRCARRRHDLCGRQSSQ